MARDIQDALKRARKEGFLCSFDMLGEGARTSTDAERYERSYAAAIEAVGSQSRGVGPEAGHGVSVKMSALSPRYESTQEARVWDELYPRIKRLALIAARYDINFTIDAEEADRLVISLKLLDRLARDAELGDWTGLGLAVQAYQKRAPEVIRGDRRVGARLGAPVNGPVGQRRLLGHGDQACPNRRASGLSGLHPKGLNRPQLPCRRASPGRRGALSLRSIRDPQCSYPGGGAPHG